MPEMTARRAVCLRREAAIDDLDFTDAFSLGARYDCARLDLGVDDVAADQLGACGEYRSRGAALPREPMPGREIRRSPR